MMMVTTMTATVARSGSNTSERAMTAASVTSKYSFHVSCNRKVDWETYCAKAMGFDYAPQCSTSESHSICILNLMDDDDNRDDTTMVELENETDTNHWMDNVNQIAASITQMSDMIRKNSTAYVDGDLPVEEASVLESTVLSFAATAANQIDSLGKAIPPYSTDYSQFCSGIVASLLLRIRKEVADPMAALQKQRTRPAMAIFQEPLACRLVLREGQDTSTVWDQLVEDDPTKNEQRFLPRHEAPSSTTAQFMAAYASNEEEEKALSSLEKPMFPKKRRNEESAPPPPKHVKFSNDTKRQNGKQDERLFYQQQQQDAVQQETQDELQREAALLEASLEGDLDSVYRVEQRMTEITALLSQFSSLVSEQQEEVTAIHQSAISSKENIHKGQESLVDAKERTKQSKHYMATLVWSVALLLLFFNYVVP